MDQAEGMTRGAESEELRIVDSRNDDEVNLFRFMVYRIRFSSGVAELPSSPSRFSEMGGRSERTIGKDLGSQRYSGFFKDDFVRSIDDLSIGRYHPSNLEWDYSQNSLVTYA